MFWTKPQPKQPSSNIGATAEQRAKDYLLGQGLIFQAANFHARVGEIDLIMIDQHTIVFIEVKYRQSGQFGGAIAAVSPKKQDKIKKCAQLYLQQQGLNEYNSPCRFDVVALDGALAHPAINWLKNAF